MTFIIDRNKSKKKSDLKEKENNNIVIGICIYNNFTWSTCRCATSLLCDSKTNSSANKGVKLFIQFVTIAMQKP